MNPSLFMLMFTFKWYSTHGPTKKYLIPDSVEDVREFVRSVDELFPEEKEFQAKGQKDGFHLSKA